MNKLIVVIMGPGKKHFAEMCLDSVKDADKILYFTQRWIELSQETNSKAEFYNNFWDETDPATNGKCRQRYLKHLKEFYPDDWCLVLDEDEILDDSGIQNVKEFINDPDRTPGIYNVKMRHFIGDLGHEDATLHGDISKPPVQNPIHIVPGRLFKISEAIKYPEHSHPVLEGEVKGACLDTTIWHLGYLPVEYMDYIFNRAKQNAKDSVIHRQEFIRQWKLLHLFGLYHKVQINLRTLPKQLCDRYEIDLDEIYFAQDKFELKHVLMVKQWKNYFKNKEVLDVGCGRGPYLCAWTILDVEGYGFDKSKFAVEHSLSANSNMWIGDILEEPATKKQFELVNVIDVLEHLKYDDLELALKNISKMTKKNILFSIPFLGDKNLDADPTHIIKEDKEWWIAQLSRYFKIKEVPEDWFFKEQLLIGEKK